MPDAPDVSFELERFAWVSDDRLEVAGRWHGVRRKLPRPTLVVEVGGRRRRLRALSGTAESTPHGWQAAFPWEGEPVRLAGAELELGRSIVVELPRPRRSAARSGDAAAAPVIPATAPEPAGAADEKKLDRERDETGQLQAAIDAARADAEAARSDAEAARSDAAAAQEDAETARAEVARLREEAAGAKAAGSQLEEARAEATAAREALEQAQEETAVARRALSAAREAEEDERADAARVIAELEELRGKHGRTAQELDAARGELAAAAERLQQAQAEGRDETQRLREELARVRDPSAPGQSRARPREAPAAQERPAPERPPPTGRFRPPPLAQEPPVPAGAPTATVTERAASWLSGAAERAREVVSPGPSVANGTARPPSAPAEPAAARSGADRAQAALARRRAQHDTRPERSWVLRGVAVALLAILLVALALIVSFLA
jgi:hypothetical protein